MNAIAPVGLAGRATGFSGAAISGSMSRSSLSRSAAPAAWDSSPQTSDRLASDPAARIEYRRNWLNVPPDMRPASTSLAPIQSTATTLAPITKMAKPVSTARAAVAMRAARKAVSAALRNLSDA